jgi:RHS repeat-associated protein
VFGNVAKQSLNTNQSVEDYEYDALQRLIEASRTGLASGTVNYTYDAIGNITSKSDFSTSTAGAYGYTGGSCGGGPNAVKSVALQAGGSRTYCYDANGNMTSDSSGTALRYDHTQRPLKITRGGITSSFDYDVDGDRFRQVGPDAVQYFPTLERRTGKDTTYAGSVAIITTTSGARRVDYQLVDRLGSVDAIADANGNLIETRGYDAFGKPRTGTWGDAARLASTATTPHGFTGHEHLNQLDLIHMNGRVYDFNLGRFTGVDPLIQSPLNSQSLNPYSYIFNNPLSGTDPTGYQACSTGTNIKGDSGINCEGLGVSGGVADKDTVAEFNKPHPPQSNGATQRQGVEGQRQQQNESISAKGSNANGAVSGDLALLSSNRASALSNSCSVPALANCGGITTDAIDKHVSSSGGYDSPDGRPNPLVTGQVDDKGRLVLTIPYAASGERGIVRQAIRDASSEWRRVGVVLDFTSSEGDAIDIRGVRSAEFITDLRGSNGQPMACSCDAAGRIGGWVPNYRQAYINADPVNGVILRSTGAHELGGHLLGLSHRSTGIMQKSGGDTRRPDANDALRLRRIYLPNGN